MSTKINLWFETFPNPALEEKIHNVGDFTRLFRAVKFKASGGWSKTFDAIVDTGAPLSVIPLDMWLDIDPEILAEHEIQGISPRKECTVPALVGNVKCVLIDDEANQSKELKILSYLALTNLVPLIIGFRNILEIFTFHSNYSINEAYLKF